MKKILFFLLLVLSFIGGAGSMLIFYPYLFPPPVLNEQVQESRIQKILAVGMFRENELGNDSFHWAKGDVKLYAGKNGNLILEMQGNFQASPGPDYFIYLNSQKNIRHEEDFLNDKKRIKLTQLKSFKGAQVYEIAPQHYQRLSSIQSISIWCETFGEYIGNADLKTYLQ